MKSNKPELESVIRIAADNEAAAISSLAIRSKAHWGYSDDFLEACRDELTYPATQIASNDFRFRISEVEGKIAGFYALEILSSEAMELEALFVEPEMIGQGIGRVLIEHAKDMAAVLGFKRIMIRSDPNAESFYVAAGGVPDGQRESDSIPGRLLPMFRIEL